METGLAVEMYCKSSSRGSFQCKMSQEDPRGSNLRILFAARRVLYKNAILAAPLDYFTNRLDRLLFNYKFQNIPACINIRDACLESPWLTSNQHWEDFMIGTLGTQQYLGHFLQWCLTVHYLKSTIQSLGYNGEKMSFQELADAKEE
jgi:hypothetical protein